MIQKLRFPMLLTITVLGLSVAWASDVTPHRGARQDDPDRYKKTLRRAAKRWSLELNLLKGLIQTESRFDAGATSRTGAAGLGQFTGIAVKEIHRLTKMKRYAQAFEREPRLLAKLRSFTKKGAYDPQLAIEATALYLHHLLRSYDNHVEAALTHYNAGGRMARLVVKHGFERARSQNLLTFSQAKTYAPHVLQWKAKFDKGWHPKKKRS